MDRDSRLVGAYGRDRKEFLRYKSSLAQAEKQAKTYEDNQRIKELYRKSPNTSKDSELPTVNRSYSPAARLEPSHTAVLKRPSVRVSPQLEGSMKDATLKDYIWTLDNERSAANSPKPIQKLRYVGKITAVVDQNAGYYERELRKELRLEDENSKRMEECLTPTYSLEPKIDLGKRLANDSLGRLNGRERSSETKVIREKDLSPGRDVVERTSLQGPQGTGKRLYKLALPPAKGVRRLQASSILDPDRRGRREQKLEESIQELDELLQRIKKRQSMRSSSVMKEAKSKSMGVAKRKAVPRLKLPGIAGVE